MPSIPCPCGSIIDLSEVPHPDGFRLVAETALEELVDSAETLHKEATSVPTFRRGLSRLLSPLSLPSPHVYQCQTCGRLAVLRHPSDSAISQWYLPEHEDGSPPSRLRSLLHESSGSDQASS
jgi:hypothetical protein